MITVNPFAEASQFVSSIAMQAFVILMVALVIIGTFFEMLHKKNVQYFFRNAKMAKQSATKTLGVGEKTSIVVKTSVATVLITIDVFSPTPRVLVADCLAFLAF